MLKLPCARKWGRWGRLSNDGGNTTQPTRARPPGVTRRKPCSWRFACKALLVPDTAREPNRAAERTKDGCKPITSKGMQPSLTAMEIGKALSDKPALKPDWGKPAVRNFR